MAQIDRTEMAVNIVNAFYIAHLSLFCLKVNNACMKSIVLKRKYFIKAEKRSYHCKIYLFIKLISICMYLFTLRMNLPVS